MRRSLPSQQGDQLPLGRNEIDTFGVMAANLRSVATDSIDDLRPITTSEKRTDNLSAGDRFAGPAIIAQDDTTTCVLPDFEVNVDRWGNLHIINLAATA